jgi:hypothetical protein
MAQGGEGPDAAVLAGGIGQQVGVAELQDP